MLRLKRILGLLLVIVMVVSILPVEALAMKVTSPTQSVTSSDYFTAVPGVYEMGDGYAVVWATSFRGTGYIQYTYNGTNYTVYDQRNGIVRTNDTVHVVKVPHEHLQGNSYTVYSRKVTSHSYAVTNYGTTISAGPIRLNAYDGGQNNFDVLVLSDVNNQVAWAKSVAARFTQEPDLVVFNGDTVSSIETKGDIESLFNVMGSVTGGKYPVVYSRGNYETRGVYSTALLDYLPTKTGEFYFDFRYGPLWGVVIDTGEDKEDNHTYYGNLANFGEYNQKQEAWLRSLQMDSTATYRLGIYHMPRLNALANGIDFTDSIGHLGLQFAVAGNEGTCEVLGSNTVGVAHATYIGGGYEAGAASLVTLNNTDKKAYITAKSSSGATVSGFNNRSVNLSTTVGQTPEALAEPAYGTHAQFTPSGSSQGTISITVPPTVFETGGDWYNVVWVTGTTSGTAKGSTGYVEYQYNGKTYQLFDEVGGYRRSYSNIHTVKVPKEHLNNNRYLVGSFLVEYSYTNPAAQVGRYYTAGDYVESGYYLFEDRNADSVTNLVVCPDIKGTDGDSSGAIATARQAVASFGTSPTYVVVNGDAVEVALYSNTDLATLFSATAAVSGGAHPVIFSRGNSECRGDNATDLIKYIPTATGEFYYTLDVGDYTFVNLDTAEDDPDDAKISYNGNPNFVKYGGRVFLDELRQEQLNWVKTLDSGKLVAISHIPFATVSSRFGLNFETALKAKGAVIAIGGHDNTYSLKETVNNSNVYTLVPGGFKSSAYNGATVTLSDDYAYIRTCQYQGSASYPVSKTVSLTTGRSVTHTATQPPQVNGVYQISTPGHLKWISQNCTSTTSFSGKTFKLVNDIDMQLVPFTPIGGNDSNNTDENTTSRAFSGTFDGNGYTIKNLNISGNHNVGFFGLVRQGTVKNLKLSGGIVTGGWYVGGIAGATFKASVLENCYSDLTVYSAEGTKVGGITGFLSGGSRIEACAHYGSVSGGHSGGNVGGIVGQIHGATTNKVISCYNRGTVMAPGATGKAGGIIGYTGNISASVEDCYNAAPVLSPGSQGAIIGSYSTSGNLSITNTYFSTGFNGASKAFKSSNTWRSALGSGSVEGLTMENTQTKDTAQRLDGDVYTSVPVVDSGFPVHKQYLHAPETTGHTFTSEVTPPTCTEGGHTTYTCTCYDSYEGNQTSPLGHSYKTVTVDPTCTQDGSKTQTCSVCGDVIQETLPATGHSYKSVVTPPTCTKKGYTTYTCTCGDSYVANEVAATGHSYKAVVTAPTCTDKGYTTHTCANCGNSYKDSEVAAKGHSYKTTTVAATCEKAGSKTHTCSSCGHKYVDTIPATGHNYKAVVTAPTCTDKGYTTHTCANCKDSYTDTEVAAKGHTKKTVAGKAATCEATGLTDGEVCSVCNVTLKAQEVIPAKGHTKKTVAGKAATCEATGLTDGEICSVCNKTLKAQEVIPAKGHTKKTVAGKAATCEATGLTEGQICSVCNKTLKAQETIPAKGHTEKTLAYKAPTCTEDGITKGIQCSVCDKILTAQQTIPATGHTKKTVAGKEATCTATGLTDGEICSVCNVTLKAQQTIPAKGHSYKSVVTAPTCTAQGYTTNTCSVCGDVSITDYKAPLNHSYTGVVTAPTCTEKGYTTYTCSRCDDSYVGNYVDAKGHREETIPGKAATCEEDGLTDGVKCSVCGEILTAQQTIPAKGHTKKTVAGKAATCTADGLTEGEICSVCNKTLKAQQTIPAIGHNYKAVVTAPTCTAEGYTTHTCANCGDSYVDSKVAATGHDYKTVIVDATCTADGSKTQTCANCGDVIVEDIPATGHDYKAVVTPPTCTAEGYTTHTCANCGDSYVDSKVAATGHDYKTVIVDATCTTDGSKTQTCANCGDVIVEVISATGHDYKSLVTAPTCTEKGYTTYTCSKCDDSYVSDYVDAKGHTEETIPGKEATCEEDGLTDGVKCSVCDEVLTAQETIPATGHTEEVIPGKAATCEEDGLTDGVKCSVCDKVLTAQETIPATGHTEKTLDYKAPTCTEDGITQGIQCSVCDKILTAQETIPATGHDYKSVVTAPTCTEEGYTTYTCSVCGDSYVADHKAPLNHSYTGVDTEPTCMEKGYTTYTCSRCDDSYVGNYVDAKGHTEETIPGEEATCEEDGLTDGVKCSVCKEILTAQETIPATGHTNETIPGKAATCEEDGLTDGIKCSVCDKVLTAQEIIPATGHTNETIPGKAATCEETGLTDGVKCSVCDKVLTAQEIIPAKGHTNETIPGKAATCEEDGLTDGIKCSVCDKVLTAQETIPAKGHTNETIPGKTPTCTETGLTDGVKCSACDKIFTEQEEIPATGHPAYENGFCTACDDYEPAVLNEEDIYEISNAGQLYWFAALVNGGETSANAIVLENILVNEDVTASELRSWTPIGVDGYTGTFDGNGKTISGLYQDGTDGCAGLVGQNGGTVKTLSVAGSYFGGTEYVGTVAGRNLGAILNCRSVGNILDGESYVGGLVGRNSGSITSCYAINTVQGGTYAGELVGRNDGTVLRCYFNSTLASYDAIGMNRGEASHVEGQTTEAFAGGEVTYLLSDGITDGTQVWYQTIGTDALPGFSGETVYTFVNCQEESAYSNRIYANGSHGYDNGVCPYCGQAIEVLRIWKDGREQYVATMQEALDSWNYYSPAHTLVLLTDAVVSYDAYPMGEYVLDLNGHALDLGNTTLSHHFKLPDEIVDTPLTIMDSVGGGKLITTAEYAVEANADHKLILQGDFEIVSGRVDICLSSNATIVVNTPMEEGELTVDAEDNAVFATAGEGVTLETGWFVPARAGYIITANEDGTLSYTRCTHSWSSWEQLEDTHQRSCDICAMVESGSHKDEGKDHLCDICDKQTSQHTETVIPGTDATCTETGLTEGVECSYCGQILTAQETIPATGHKYDTVVTAPTCTEFGYTTYTCHCGDTYTADEVAATGHRYETVTVEPTCTADGSKTDTCANCGDVVAETIPATGHKYDAVVTAPTCTQVGYTTYTCHCGDTYTADEIAATGHRYETVTVEPTCTVDGSKTDTCANCGDVIVETLPATGHTEEAVPGKAPTCTETGLTDGVKCVICEETLTAQEIIPATGHPAYENGFCTVCDGYEPASVNEEGYYEIGNAGQLYWFAQLVNNGAGTANALLIADITVNENVLVEGELNQNTSNLRNWTEIRSYEGTFDGNGKIIFGLYNSNDTSYVGLVGFNYGTMKNVTISDSYHKASNYHGVLVGNNCGTVINCRGLGNLMEGTTTYFGGLVGLNDGMVVACYSTTRIEGGSRYGALIGYNDDGTVQNCYFNSDMCGSGIGLDHGTTTNVSGKDTAAFASGEVAYLLNDGITDGTQAWYQTIGTDALPGYTGETVYQIVVCDGETVLYYSNTYKIIDHTQEIIPGKVPTCTETGLTEGVKCSVCDKVLTEQEIIPATGHTEEILPYQAPTCTETGLTAGVKCSVCGKTLTAQETIPATGHPAYENGFCTACDAYEPAVLNEEDIYEISNAGQLYWFAALVNGGETSANAIVQENILVNEDVTASDLRSWTPIGVDGYTGTFDGNGKTISGLYQDGTDGCTGLVGRNEGTVKTLSITGSYFGGTEYVGTVAGRNLGAILNCRSVSNILEGESYVGGLVGRNSGSTTSCYSINTVSGGTDTGELVGCNDGSVVNCYWDSDLATKEAIGTNRGEVSQAEGLNAEAFASGEVTYLLSGGITDGTQVWYQTIGTDALPGFSGETVYTFVNCQKESAYSNRIYADGSHGYDNGFCLYCGQTIEVLRIWKDGREQYVATMQEALDSWNYYSPAHTLVLLTDAVVSYDAYPMGEYVLDLNGHTLDLGNTTLSHYFKLPDEIVDTPLTIMDSVGGGKLITTAEYAVEANADHKLILQGDFEIVSGRVDICLSYNATIVVNTPMEEGELTVDAEDNAVFATAGEGVTLETGWFVPARTGYIITANEDGTLSYTRCAHSWSSWEQLEDTHQRSCDICAMVESGSHKDEGKDHLCDICDKQTSQHTEVIIPGTDATCTETGLTEGVECSYCGQILTAQETIPATGHKYDTVVTAPTCTEVGYTTYTCHCGDTYTADEVAATGHRYETVTVEPTCTVDGSKTDTCANCGDVIAETIPATGHSYENGKCGICGAEDPDYIKKPTLVAKYPTVSFEDVIVMNIYYTASDLEDVVEMGLLTFSEPVEMADINAAEDIVPGYTWNESAKFYMSSTNGIPAKELGKQINFAVYAKLSDGSYVYSAVYKYSVKTYAYNQLKTGTAEMKALVVALLNYGAAAQLHFNYQTDALVNADLTQAQQALVEAYREDMISVASKPDASKLGAMVDNGGYTRRYATVSFEGAFCINYYFRPSKTPAGEITMYVWNQGDYNAVEALSKDNATQAITMELLGSGEYQAVVEGIAAKNLNEAVYVSFCYSDGTTEYCSGVSGYSIGQYCKTQAAKTGTMADLAAATAVYGHYAKLRFSKNS